MSAAHLRKKYLQGFRVGDEVTPLHANKTYTQALGVGYVCKITGTRVVVKWGGLPNSSPRSHKPSYLAVINPAVQS